MFVPFEESRMLLFARWQKLVVSKPSVRAVCRDMARKYREGLQTLTKNCLSGQNSSVGDARCNSLYDVRLPIPEHNKA